MSRKPETVFIASVNRHLPLHVHHEKMCNPYSSGTPDVYYSAKPNDIWVEYKFIPKIPARDKTEVVADCTKLQLEWLRDRYKEGRTVYVIVGCPDGGVIMRDLEWEHPVTASEFRSRCIPRKELAAFIYKETTGVSLS